MKAALALALPGALLMGIGLLFSPAAGPATVGDQLRVVELLTEPRQAGEAQVSGTEQRAPIATAGSADGAEVTPSGPHFSITGKGGLPQARQVVPTSVRLGDQPASPIVEAGVEANGEMEVPDNVTDVAWYGFGPSPGENGSAVLAAHVDLAGQGPGVFFGLQDLPIGSSVEVGFSDGSTTQFRTFARARYDKDDLPTDLIFSRSGKPVLTLITCGGGFNPSIGRYDSNVVVYAEPVAGVEPGVESRAYD